MSAYPASGHRHFVTYELTMRVPRAGEDAPPDWPFQLLTAVAGAARVSDVLFIE